MRFKVNWRAHPPIHSSIHPSLLWPVPPLLVRSFVRSNDASLFLAHSFAHLFTRSSWSSSSFYFVVFFSISYFSSFYFRFQNPSCSCLDSAWLVLARLDFERKIIIIRFIIVKLFIFCIFQNHHHSHRRHRHSRHYSTFPSLLLVLSLFLSLALSLSACSSSTRVF